MPIEMNADFKIFSRRALFLIVVAAGLWSDPVSGRAAEGVEFFETKVRPVLVEHCHECHSHDAKKLKGGLRLDSRTGLLKGGDVGPAIVPGSPAASRLIRAVGYEDVDFQMPPKRRLPASVVEDLRKWIEMGAPWPEGEAAHVEEKAEGGFDIEARRKSQWAWQPVKATVPGNLKNVDWPAGAIDRHILAKLEEQGLKPAPPADKGALIRRANFDLIGLPPTPEEIDAFLADDSPKAFEKVVDRLLASKHFGERWARHWLDLVRYAETMGHEFDYPIYNAWMYRDYIIRALNEDVPYDQLVKEHIAGDLLENPRCDAATGLNESAIGTAFYWFSQQTHSPVDSRQAQSELVANQIDVLSKTFMAMTVSCARCHDHKFDAISTEDFYSLFGVLSSSRFTHLPVGSDDEIGQAKRELAALRKEIEASAFLDITANAGKIGDYIKAVDEIKRMKASEAGGAGSGEVFEDFEGETYDGWTAEGEAFAKGPVRQDLVGKYQGQIGAVGRGFLNSHNVWRGGSIDRSDRYTGTLTSRPFKVSKPYIHFLIGGGAHAGKTEVQLLVDEKVILRQSGRNANRMAPARFDVAGFIGREARLRVVDEVKGGWGNIGLDHIVFSGFERYFGGDNQPEARDGRLEAVAAKRGLDLATLGRWRDALAKLNVLPADSADKAGPTADATVLGDFSKGLDRGWFMEGEAFEWTGERPGLMWGGGGLEVGSPGWMHSGTLSKRLQGALRSPTFVIDKPYIHILGMGERSRINVCVNNFTLIKNPIYGGLKVEMKNKTPHWITVDVDMWRGQQCYLEFIDNSAVDPASKGYPADGWLAVKRVAFSDSRQAPGWTQVDKVGRLPGESADGLARRFVARVKGELAGLSGEADAEGQGVPYLEFLLRRDLFPIGEDRALAEVLKRYAELEKGLPAPTMIAGMTEGTPRDERVFIRGRHSTLGGPAARRFLRALDDIQSDVFEKGSGRLELAEDLVHPDNPLTARVMVNRIWHHLTGRGIVPTTDDFGVLGRRPTHPELLDWLADRFQKDGWSIKGIVRLIALSKTYRMSSRPDDAEAEAKDPNNELLHRMRVRRLQGETIRDSVLAVSGSLDRTMYGASVPIHLTAFMEGRGRPGRSGPLDGDGRRSIYVEVRRNFLSPMMLAFDTPLPASTIGKRNVSNVPAQGLIMMNDPFVVEQARKWAERLVREQGLDDEARLRKAYLTAYGRPPTEQELADGTGFLKAQGGDPVEAWAGLCHVMFAVKEFMFVN